MLKINKILSKKGFTLIELMVAAVILAIAVLGIFLAFSNAWMGMANARDRTVATNYAREAMENVKNMDFEMVTNINLGIAESVGTKFTRVITVNTESDNLKKIETTVFWTNRQGQYVSVEPEMYINRTIFNPGLATKLVLYADPYYTVLPSAGTSTIIAVIKDSNGNTKIDWDSGDINFTILGSPYSDFPKLPLGSIGSELGYLESGVDVTSVTPNEGRAEITFTAAGYMDDGQLAQGEVVIEASVDLPNGGGTISDTITIDVTLDVVRIKLSADTYSIDDDGSISTLTAELVNSIGETEGDASNEITFNISGEGIFVDFLDESPLPNTVAISPSGGIAHIKVKSITDTPGVATVIASSPDLLVGTVNIIIVGDASSIFVSVDHDLIYIDDIEGATVKVEIQDINGIPVEYGEKIILTISGGTGTFTPESPLNFAGTSFVETTFSPTSVGIITITANDGGLTEGSAIIEVREALIADTITITAVPKNILAGGDSVSEITATIKQGSTVISNYSNDITFEIISDTSSPPSASLFYKFINKGIGPFDVPGVDVDEGKVVVDLSPSSNVGICTIEVSTLVDPEFHPEDPPISETIEVGFYAGEDHIELSTVPPNTKMLVEGDTCTVTAEVVDEEGTLVTTYNEDITFTILVGWPKVVKFAATGTSSLTQTLIGGQTSVILIPQKEAGTVTLKASSFTGTTDITGYLNIQVDTTPINLVEDSPAYISTEVENRVTFDIDVQGAEVILGEMRVSWTDNIASEILNEVEIGGTVVYSNGDGVTSGTDIDIDPTNNLPTGISTINLYFNLGEDISGKTFNIIFNPSTDYYPVEFEISPT